MTVAEAAAAQAAGDPTTRDHLLDRAAHLEHLHHTYYGAAWVALGRLTLTGSFDRWCI
jgi:endoglucanase